MGATRTAKNAGTAGDTRQTNDAAVLPGTDLSSARKAELEKWLETKRSLVFSSDVDGAYTDLYKAITQKRNSPTHQPDILRLRLKDSTDEACHRDELRRILKDGGTLVLDLRGADPKLIKEWNSLYDFDAAGKGVKEISKELRIVALADKTAEAPPESVTSRSAKFYDQSKVKKEDQLLALQGESNAQDGAHHINLHQDADRNMWRYELLGSRQKEGALIKAMREGVALEIQNAPLDQSTRGGAYDPELANLLRQVAVEGRIMHNGEWVYGRDIFKLTLTQREIQPPQSLRLQRENETDHNETSAGRLATFYVNRHTVGMLFSRTVFHGGKVARKTGLLDIRPKEGAAPIKFVITEDLPLGKWNRLVSHPAFNDPSVPITIAVKDSVSVPRRYRDLQSTAFKEKAKKREKTDTTPKQTPLSDLSNAVRDQKIILIKSELDLAHAEIKKQLKAPVYLQLTPYRTDEELWEAVDQEKLVTEKSRALQTLQEADGIVVLSGIDSRRDLFNEQPGLLAPQPYLLVHGRVVPIHGKLLLVERPKEGRAHAESLSNDNSLIRKHCVRPPAGRYSACSSL